MSLLKRWKTILRLILKSLNNTFLRSCLNFFTFSFSLTKKKQGKDAKASLRQYVRQVFKTKRSATHKASLLRVLSGSRSVFKLRWLRKPGAGVHERCEPKVSWHERGRAVRQTKALGWRSWWLFVILFCGRKKY